jgi:hypothetical protein
MTSFSFEDISFTGFEKLARDLVQARELAQGRSAYFVTHSEGKDNAIDFRDESKRIYGQVKRHTKSVRGLISKLVKEDLPKIQKHAPARYILVTALSLTWERRDEIIKFYC